ELRETDAAVADAVEMPCLHVLLFPHLRNCRDTITPVALQKHFGPLDTEFHGDSMSKNKLFGGNVPKTFRQVWGPGKLVEPS
ncbi:hypothetical protein, partial [Mesorhizobium sp.]|uniref:hypothetical protein n=1 Tax=Mesorhizobium sp. TaxID=1871066 RepID=UPI0025E420CC